MKLDVLIFAAHPDDAELNLGGTICSLTKQGKKVGIIDLTRGEMGTRGNTETRKK
ncbi:MAG: PIG-L family deacetylase, partial [Balneola sp.]